MSRRSMFAVVLVLNVLGYCVLSFYQTSSAASPGGNMPFVSSTEQRVEMLDQLKEIKDLLKEQNALLRSGELRVIVTLPKAAEPAGDAQGRSE
jgi:hypothetical protein